MSLCDGSIWLFDTVVSPYHNRLQEATNSRDRVGVGANNEPESQWDIFCPDFILNLNFVNPNFSITHLFVKNSPPPHTHTHTHTKRILWIIWLPVGGGGGGGVHQNPVVHRDKWMDVVTSNSFANLPTHIMIASGHGNDFCITGYLWWGPPVISDFPSQIPVVRSFDMFSQVAFDPNLFGINGIWMEGDAA